MRHDHHHSRPSHRKAATALAAGHLATRGSRWVRWTLLAGFGIGLTAFMASRALAAGGHGAHDAPAATHAAAPVEAATAPADNGRSQYHPRTVAEQLRAMVEGHPAADQQVTLLIGNETLAQRRAAQQQDVIVAAADHGGGHGDGGHTEVITPKAAASHGGGHDTHAAAPAPSNASRAYIKARAAALAGGHDAPGGGHGGAHGNSSASHWDYTGDTGPQAWGGMKPEFGTCDSGQRQSPIHIQSMDALPGPAEPIEFHYMPSGGSVVNNGHTIQVDPMGHNYIKVRGSVYRLVQFHFHHPAEEKINYKGFAMVVHLVHKNEAGQLAVVAVLLDVGMPNPMINKVWTHMPLDVNDRVRLPDELVDLFELLPSDQRYFQFMGSLTTPPCTEGVLWLVLKQPVTVGVDQLKLFTRLFPMNARPSQAVNGRIIREAM